MRGCFHHLMTWPIHHRPARPQRLCVQRALVRGSVFLFRLVFDFSWVFFSSHDLSGEVEYGE